MIARVIAAQVVALLVALALIGALASAADTDRSRTVGLPDAERGRVVVTGCHAEDDCHADYRALRDGRAVWIIRRDLRH